MIQAELRGKIPSRLQEAEDLLTSNVFSFFKYADRRTYLKEFLSRLGILVPDEELPAAEFRFWPRYDDWTEPDLVIIIDRYYILIEAKHLSDFGEATDEKEEQVVREFEGGRAEARSLEKDFRYVAITSHYNRPTRLFTHLPQEIRNTVQWTNWHAVAALLLSVLENPGNAPDAQFAADLYHLLDKKNLRGFLPFHRISREVPAAPSSIFFQPQSALFRGDFIGFVRALEGTTSVGAIPYRLFYQRHFFFSMTNTKLEAISESKILLGGTP